MFLTKISLIQNSFEENVFDIMMAVVKLVTFAWAAKSQRTLLVRDLFTNGKISINQILLRTDLLACLLKTQNFKKGNYN